jgi:ACS family tartrate transporter-like MFS transporter
MQQALSVSESTQRKIAQRILPFFFLLYVISYMDRANVSFAKLPMSADLGFSEAIYGLGAGIFFLGYFLLEIPGALIIERWSAKLYMSRILITWGVCTIFEGLVHTPRQFYFARFCLGLAEAGFFPGTLVYFSHWFPQQTRARGLSGFIFAVPVSFVIGAPISALCLSLHGFGLTGWRWLFILQGIPAVICGVIAPLYLTDRPRNAAWLELGEREWLQGELDREKELKRSRGTVSVRDVLLNRMVWLLAIALFLIVLASYGYIFWLPTAIQKASGYSIVSSTILSAVPFCAAAITLIFAGRSSDRTGERKLHSAVPLLLAAVFFSAVTIPAQSFPLTMLCLTLTGALLWAWTPSFWVLPTIVLGDSAAALSLGLINSIGNLGGFVGPTIVGHMLARWHSYSFVVWFLSGAFVLAAVLILIAPLSSGYLRSNRDRHVGASKAQITSA